MEKIDPNIERELLLKAGGDDETAFVQLLAPYQNNLYTTFLRMIGDQQVAEELLQDTALKVWLNRHQLPEILNFGGWLYKVAANIGYNHLDKTKREQSKAREFTRRSLSLSSFSFEDPLLEKEYGAILQQAIDRLPPRQKQTYLLIRQQGLSREEAARELGISPETVKWNLEQAVRSIRSFCIARIDFLLTLLVFLKK